MPKKPDQDPEDEFLKDLESLPNDLFSGSSPKKKELEQNKNSDAKFSAPIIQGGEFTCEDTALLSRLIPWNTCPICSDPVVVCPDMFDHAAEVAITRAMHLAAVLVEIINGPRDTLRVLGADTSNDIDRSITSIIDELNRIKILLPKLRASQEGMNGV